MKTLIKNTTTGFALGAILIIITAGIFLHDTSIQEGALWLFIGAAILRTGIAMKD